MAKHLKKRGIKPDLILCSPALRTKTTAQIIAKELDCIKLIQYDKELYEADEKTIFAKLIEINENLMTVFIIGHNPGLNDFLSTIVGFDENFPTCADNFAKL
jgi:phosphohistidine phosphatase